MHAPIQVQPLKTRYSGDLNTKLFEVWNSNEQLCATKKSTVVGHRKGFWIAENLEWFSGLMWIYLATILLVGRLRRQGSQPFLCPMYNTNHLNAELVYKTKTKWHLLVWCSNGQGVQYLNGIQIPDHLVSDLFLSIQIPNQFRIQILTLLCTLLPKLLYY